MRSEFAAAALAVLLFAAGDALAAAWGKTGRWWWLAATLVAGNLAWLAFAHLNRTVPLATAGAVVNLGLVLLAVVSGWLFFGERPLPLERVALAIGLVSLALFAYARMTAQQPAPPPHVTDREFPT